MTKLLFQAPYQGVAKGDKVRSPHPKLRVLASGVADDRLEYLTFIERADDGGDHVHQFDLLTGDILREEGSCIRRQFEKPVVKYVRQPSTHRPQRVE